MQKKYCRESFRTVHMNDSGVLYEQRIRLGMTQKPVAEKAGIPFQNYQRFESGERKIRTASFKMACKVLEALEMDIAAFWHNEYVIGEAVWKSPEGLRFERGGRLVDVDVVEELTSENQ